MENLFKNGDVVELKSTSVPMTVTQSPGDDDKKYPHEPRKDYLCVWFKGAQHLEGAFDEHALQAYTPPAKK